MKFELVGNGEAQFCIDKNASDYRGLSHVAKYIIGDIKLVTGKEIELVDKINETPQIIAATKGSHVADKLLADLGVDLSNKHEVFVFNICQIEGTEKLVIIGSETIATIYGMYHISKLIGVSEWVYWGDAMPKFRENIVFEDDVNFVSREPSVYYRGFFMNDEWPSLGNFVSNTFGDFNEFFYEKVFDLLLRMNGNYFWPAMWSASLPLDGSEDPLAIIKLATDLGITIGQSHHEPLMRASEEWDKVKSDTNNVGYGADWNYYTNRDGLYRYWEDGVKRDKDFKHMITIGMRGERDTMMLGEDSTIQENVELLRQIITDQNEIIKNNGCENMPKMLALYKEVEDFYYGGDGVKGLKGWDALDDTILLLSDDNFGNLRTLPTEDIRDREAGFGLYYHFDYHGGPISYEWINSSQLHKVWEEMTQAYEYGIKKLWIVNVGDIRPNELPLSYFMDLAYDFDKYGSNHKNETKEYIKTWTNRQFAAFAGEENICNEIADMLYEYSLVFALRKPESMNPNVFDPNHFEESQAMIKRAKSLINRAKEVKALIEKTSIANADKFEFGPLDTYFGLVYFPVVAGMNVFLMNLYAGKNAYYAENELPVANAYADKVEACVALDKELQEYYNKEMSGGKWDGMMLSNHVWFKTWNEEGWSYPEAIRVDKSSGDGVAIRAFGSDELVTDGNVLVNDIYLISGDNPRNNYFKTTGFEVISKSEGALDFKVKVPKGIKIFACEAVGCQCTNIANMTGETEANISSKTGISRVSFAMEDMSAYTEGEPVLVEVEGKTIEVNFAVNVCCEDKMPEKTVFEANGLVSIGAADYAKKTSVDGYKFEELSEFNEAAPFVKVFPTGRNFDEPGYEVSPSVTYNVCVEEAGTYKIKVLTAPVNNLENGRTMKYALGVNGGDVVVGDTIPEKGYGLGGGPWDTHSWSMGVLNNEHFDITEHELKEGLNEITFMARDAGFVLKGMVIYKDNCPKAYMQPQPTPIMK